jgi:superfamily II DNA/RNA helicase
MVRLSWVDMVVVDEADRMADMGFLPAVRKLIDLTSPTRQTLLFSATLEGPVDRLIRDYQHDPVRHDVDVTDADRGEVTHHFWRVEPDERVGVTAALVHDRGPTVVFCRTKHGADRLAARLGRSGLNSAAIHGDRSQSQRERALAAFRAGKCEVLVATDVAARGIHIDAVPLVVHFDPPADATDYIHRSGRTGRAGADGSVVSLVGTHQLASSRKMQRELGLRGEVVPSEVQPMTLDTHPTRSASPGATTETVATVRSRRPRGTDRKGSRAKAGSARRSATAATKPSPGPNGRVLQADDGRSTDRAKRVNTDAAQKRGGSRPSSRLQRSGRSSGARRRSGR